MPEQTVLAECRHLRLEELEGWRRSAEDRLSVLARDHGGIAGPVFVVFHGAVSGDSDGPVEICVPLRGRAPDRETPEGVAVRTEPAHREAYVRVSRAQHVMP